MSVDVREDDTPAPDTYQLAAELNVDAVVLRQFVKRHPNPTAPTVLGWAHGHNGLTTDPAALRDDVEAWLLAGGRQ